MEAGSGKVPIPHAKGVVLPSGRRVTIEETPSGAILVRIGGDLDLVRFTRTAESTEIEVYAPRH